MSERYTRLFSLAPNLYSQGSPLIILAGALLKDNQSSKILVQLKLKSISVKNIKAVKVLIKAFDVSGELLETETTFDYLDLDVTRDAEFGHKTPIILKNNSTRAFELNINEVIFDDNSTWKSKNDTWKSLLTAENLIDTFKGDSELVKEFRFEFGTTSKYNPTEDRDLWMCTCGYINRNSEEKCHHCGIEYQTLKSVNIAELNEAKEARLEKERIIRDNNERIVRERNKKMAKFAAIVTPIIVAIIIIISVMSNYKANQLKYETAINLINTKNPSVMDYDSAIEIFEALGNFKDSSEKSSEAKYKLASEHLKLKSYNSALEILEKLGDYKDSPEIVEQLKFRAEVVGILESCSGKYSSRADETSSYYGFNKAAKLIKNFKGEKTEEMKKLYDDINIALKYYGKWKIESGKLEAVGLTNSVYKNSVKKIAFNLGYNEVDGVYLTSLPVEKGSEKKNGHFSYYTYYTENFVISNEKKYVFVCRGIKYSQDVSYIPAIKNNSFKIKLFEDGKYTANIVLSR